MAQIITAPSIELPKFTSVFLAGGITNCKEWQEEVIEKLEGRVKQCLEKNHEENQYKHRNQLFH